MKIKLIDSKWDVILTVLFPDLNIREIFMQPEIGSKAYKSSFEL